MSDIHYPSLPCNALLCRYNEIAMKGRNRLAFETTLIGSLVRTLSPMGSLHVFRERGRIFAIPASGRETFSPADHKIMTTRLPWIPGLASASPGFLIKPDLEAAEDLLDRTFETVYHAACDAFPGGTPIPFRVRVNRSDKTFPMVATEIECRLADRLLPKYPRLSVDLKKPSLCVELEIRRRRAFFSYQRIAGPGGLPAGTGGRALALLSGGIDSPVACYQVMRRGCTLDFLTFHSEPYTPPALITKVAELARILNRYQPPGRLLAVNLLPVQRAIRDACANRFRTVLYRRFMIRIATEIANDLKAEALITGDNMGQVASQTLPNLTVISAASPMLILRPLLAAEKRETMMFAERIGTYEVSIQQVPDSCTVFAPQNPATVSFVPQIEREERFLSVPELVHECLGLTTEVDIDTGESRPWEREPTSGGPESVSREDHFDEASPEA